MKALRLYYWIVGPGLLCIQKRPVSGYQFHGPFDSIKALSEDYHRTINRHSKDT